MSQFDRMTLTGAFNQTKWVVISVVIAAANAALALAASSHPLSVVPLALTFAIGYLGAAVIVPVRRWRRPGSLLLMGLSSLELLSMLYSLVFHLEMFTRPGYLLHVALAAAAVFVGRILSRT
jgi:hypothetical protein